MLRRLGWCPEGRERTEDCLEVGRSAVFRAIRLSEELKCDRRSEGRPPTSFICYHVLISRHAIIRRNSLTCHRRYPESRVELRLPCRACCAPVSLVGAPKSWPSSLLHASFAQATTERPCVTSFVRGPRANGPSLIAEVLRSCLTEAGV